MSDHTVGVAGVWTQFFVTSLAATGEDGHIPADRLRYRIETHDGSEAYHCAFDLEARPDFSDYKGAVRPALGYVWFDFDSKKIRPEDRPEGEQAHEEARAFVAWLNVGDLFIAYSGSKGFHVGVPLGYFGLSPSENLGRELHRVAVELKKRWPSLDTTIYNANRKFRVLGSKHPKTKLYKCRLSQAELITISLDGIKLKARERGALTVEGASTGMKPIAQLTGLVSATARLETARERVTKEWMASSGEQAFKECSFLKFNKEYPAQVSEPQWYAALSIVSRFQEGRKQCHAISHGHPHYNAHNCNEKIDQALAESAPRTCENVATLWEGCAKCPHFQKINSPVNILTKEEKKELAATKPKERDIARIMLTHADGTLLRQDKSLFRYKDGYWKELSITQIDSMKKAIMDAYGGIATSKIVDSTFMTFRRELTPVPEGINLFDPHPFCVNFQNGTLHIRQSKEFTYTTEFLPHSRTDFLNCQVPFNYDPANKEVNTKFLEMLERVFKGDPDKDEKIRAVRQMFGASLIPAFPRLFFLWGKSGCGKSTVMQIAAKLMSEENISGVDPGAFKGFGMESMIGKLVNIVMDVDTKKPISDAQIKQIIDRRKIRIERKGIADIYGTLPAVHLFGGNAIPPTLEGELGAHERRWTFIHFQHVQTHGLYNKEFHHEVFDSCPQGVLNFALEGLKDLLDCRGHYTVPESGKAKMKEWQEEGDRVAGFLEDVANGEVEAVKSKPDARINRVKLYDAFKNWSENSGDRWVQLRNKQFYDALRSRGFDEKESKGVRYFTGFQWSGPPEPDW